MDSQPQNRKLLMIVIYISSVIIILLAIVQTVVGILWVIKHHDSEIDSKIGKLSIGFTWFVLLQLSFMGLAIYKKDFLFACIAFLFLLTALITDLVMVGYSSRKYVQVSDINQFREDVIKSIYVKSYQLDENSRITVDNWQFKKKCCGYKGRFDPEVLKDIKSGLLLDSCCPINVKQCKLAVAFQDDCTSKIIVKLKRTTTVLICLSTLSAAIEIILLIAFIILLRDYRQLSSNVFFI